MRIEDLICSSRHQNYFKNIILNKAKIRIKLGLSYFFVYLIFLSICFIKESSYLVLQYDLFFKCILINIYRFNSMLIALQGVN